MVRKPHYAISAFIPKPNFSMSTSLSPLRIYMLIQTDSTVISNHGQFYSVDFRPVSSMKGTIKKITSLYRKQLQSCAQGEVKTPFLCINMMCPAGTYDPNVEPTKDDVLFTAEEEVLGIFARFLEDVYGSSVEEQAAPNQPSRTQVTKPTTSAHTKSQMSNTTAESQLSDLDPISSPSKERGVEQAVQGTSLAVRLAELTSISDLNNQPFTDISMTQQATGGRDTQHENVEFDMSDLTEGEEEEECSVQSRGSWDAAQLAAVKGKQPRKIESYLNQNSTEFSCHEERSQPRRRHAINKDFGFPCNVQDKQDLDVSRSKQTLKLNPFKCPSTIKPGTFQIPKDKGPMDAYLRPHPMNTSTTLPQPIRYPPLPSGTPLYQIPNKPLPKRKQVTTTNYTTDLTPTKQLCLNQYTATPPSHPRVSFPPKFSPPYRRTTLLNQGLTTPEPSPHKKNIQYPHYYTSPTHPAKQSSNIYLSQRPQLEPQPQLPTPKSTSTPAPLNKAPRQILSVRLRNPSVSEIASFFSRSATGKEDKIGFDVSDLSESEVSGLAGRCRFILEGLIKNKSKNKYKDLVD